MENLRFALKTYFFLHKRILSIIYLNNMKLILRHRLNLSASKLLKTRRYIIFLDGEKA